LTHHTIAKPRVHTEASKKLYTEDTPVDVDHGVLPFRPPPIPVATFARMHNARAEGDYALAKRLLGEMRAYGYSIVPIAMRAKGGAR
jgi:hypothetical protein